MKETNIEALRVLVINPNTSTSMTESFRPILDQLPLANKFNFTYWTCPSGPTIIRSAADMQESVSHCLPLLLKLSSHFDGFIAACYADHPLVRLLQSQIRDKPVVGIFDASVYAALHLVSPGSSFGILTTGKPYEYLLNNGVASLLHHDAEALRHFAGVAASGVGLMDLNPDPVSASSARSKITKATKRLLQSYSDLEAICMGGVILIGMEYWVREACEQVLGVCEGRRIKIVDQLAAGMLTLEALLLDKSPNDIDYRLALRC